MNDSLIYSINSATEETLPMREKAIVPAMSWLYHIKGAVSFER